MSESNLQKKIPESVKEKTQYALAFGVIATMLFVAGFPMFIIIFFGIFAYFLWKTFASPAPHGTREVFEFYLAANEILRDDERRWFGFEVQETIGRGERILQTMNGAPPLVYFTLGALYHKVGDYKSAVTHLAYTIENENSDEKTYLYASPELKNYVRVLRKIEREPAEAPKTSAAVRALERARRTRGKAVLEQSRILLKEHNQKNPQPIANQKTAELPSSNDGAKRGEYVSITAAEQSLTPSLPNHPATAESFDENDDQPASPFPDFSPNQFDVEKAPENGVATEAAAARKRKTSRKAFTQRPPISEVLRDIYGEK